MKIAIITWCTYTNFGTYLQAYALQNVLRNMGYDAELLDDSDIINIQNKSQIRKIAGHIKTSILYSLKPYLWDERKKDKISIQLFKEFRSKLLSLDNELLPLEDLDKKYDIYICGSDQIWNPFGLEQNPRGTFYYAAFSHQKKVAYAPSIGLDTIPTRFSDKLSTLLSDFASLSCREANGARELQEITNKDVAVVVDPTFLLNQNDWENVFENENKVSTSESFVLLYLLTYNNEYRKYAESFARERNLKLVTIHSIHVDFKGMETVSSGPQEFLWLISNANYVLTDSFHGTIFSIIFKKQFVTFKRFRDNDSRSQNSRVSNLLKLCGLESHLISDEGIDNFPVAIDTIDYEKVYVKLQPQIDFSRFYLQSAIDK